jgi:hypothetical protein
MYSLPFGMLIGSVVRVSNPGRHPARLHLSRLRGTMQPCCTLNPFQAEPYAAFTNVFTAWRIYLEAEVPSHQS